MLTMVLLLGGAVAFIGIAWGMYRTRRGTTRAALALAALVLLVALVWTGMALVEPGRA